MSDILTPEQIASLVEAAKEGRVPEHAASTPRRSHRVRTVDFSRPTKFTIDHSRRIERMLESFCQMAATRLSGELRWPIELEAINTTQATWAAAQGMIPAGALGVMLEVQPIGTRMLMTVEQPFVLSAIECLLGGSPEKPQRERRLSEIEWALTRRLIESLVIPLSLGWRDLAGVTLEVGSIEPHNDTGQIASVSEPTLVAVVESRLNKQSSAISLLIPWIAIDPVAQRISGRESNPMGDDGPDVRIGDELGSVPVTVRAEVAAVELAVEEILGLQPGAVVVLGPHSEQGVSLYAENVKVASGHPGRLGPRRAVQVRSGEWEQA